MTLCHECRSRAEGRKGRWIILGEKKMDLSGSSCAFNAFETGVKEDWRGKVTLPREFLQF